MRSELCEKDRGNRWKEGGRLEVDEKCKGPRKTAKSGEVSQKYGIYCESHLLAPLLFFSPSPSLCSPRPFFLLYMLPCSPSSLALCATFARTSLVLVIYHTVSHAVRFPFMPLRNFFSLNPSDNFSGHVLCLSCCNTILEKTTSRLSPVCPFCREQFSRGTVRVIRIDCNGPCSGWSTPRRSPNSPRPPLIEDDFPNDLLKGSAPVYPDPGEARARDARMLESKVARVASKKCSVEEVTALQQEVDRWLTEVTAADAVRAPSSSAQSSSLTRSHIQSSALHLSSLLLKAILANHHAFSDASKVAKHAEASLKLKVDELEHEKGRLEVELHK